MLNNLETSTKRKIKQMGEVQQKSYNNYLTVVSSYETKIKALLTTLNEIVNSKESPINIISKVESLLKSINTLEVEAPKESKGVLSKIDKRIYQKIESYLVKYTIFELADISMHMEKVDTTHIFHSNMWVCINCDTYNKGDSECCSECYSFKPLEFYTSIENEKPLESEITQITNRRENEKSQISGRDVAEKFKIPTDGLFYIIEKEWLYKWKSFIFNAPYKGVSSYVGKSKLLGILPPGPVNNESLLLEDKATPKKDLLKNEHYRAVNEYVWEAYIRYYGGGPAIVRNSFDIYSQQVKSKFDGKLSKPEYYHFLDKHPEAIANINNNP